MKNEFQWSEPLPYRLLSRLAIGLSSEIWRGEIALASANTGEMAIRISHTPLTDIARREHIRLSQYLVALCSIAGIPGIHSIEEWAGRLVVVTTLAKANCMQFFLKAGAHTQESTHKALVDVMDEVAFTLDSINANEFIHAGISPEHVLLSDGPATLAGFSRCHRLGDQLPHQTNTDLATQLCMSPEMRCGLPGLASDQYSLAATYLALRAGILPCGDLSWPDHYLGVLGVNERKVIGRALSRSPGDRFETCQQLASELRLVLT